jgi:serpin B
MNFNVKSADSEGALSHFGLGLLQRMHARSSTRQLMISPLSLWLSLTMASAGADGDTALEMADALELGRLGDHWRAVFDYVSARISAYAADLDIATAMVIGEDLFPYVYPEFRAFLKRQFRAEIFDSAPAVNSWVATLTHGRIKEVVASADDREFVLVNAVYLKLPWRKAFMKHKTYHGLFTSKKGASSQCRMMVQTGTFNYTETDSYQAIFLPYESSASLGAMIILPRRMDAGLSAIVSTIRDSYFTSLARLACCDGRGDRLLGTQRVEIHLPKFTTEFSAQFGGNILAMPGAFSDSADFGKIVRGLPLPLGRVAHKTFVQVDEAGTEAAAATTVSFKSLEPTVEVTPVMRVDHPFVFMVVDASSKEILFAGTVHNVDDV